MTNNLIFNSKNCEYFGQQQTIFISLVSISLLNSKVGGGESLEEL